MKAFLLTLFIAINILGAKAQEINVSGDWYGIGYVEMVGEYNSYLSELKLTQNGKKITGEFNYFYRSDEVKTTITGKYDSVTRLLHFNAAPILNFQARNIKGADCPMEGDFTLLVSKMETTLSGKFSPTNDYRIVCPSINIKFKKAIPPPPEPTPPPPFPNPIVQIKPRPKYVPPTAKSTTPAKPFNVRPGDTTKPNTLAPVTVTAQPVVKKVDSVDLAERKLKKRSFDIPPVIEVEADSLRVSIYDNGDIDNDTVSLFYNRKLVAYQQMLSDKPITFTLPVDTTSNEISMFAENLGKLPPNTALAVIYAGDQRYELNLLSTFMKNAAIRFKKKVKHYDPRNIN